MLLYKTISHGSPFINFSQEKFNTLQQHILMSIWAVTECHSCQHVKHKLLMVIKMQVADGNKNPGIRRNTFLGTLWCISSLQHLNDKIIQKRSFNVTIKRLYYFSYSTLKPLSVGVLNQNNAIRKMQVMIYFPCRNAAFHQYILKNW